MGDKAVICPYRRRNLDGYWTKRQAILVLEPAFPSRGEDLLGIDRTKPLGLSVLLNLSAEPNIESVKHGAVIHGKAK